MKKQNFENYKLDLVNNKRFNSMSEFEFIKDPRKNKTQLGVGSFGEVKLALHKKSGQKYAIKIMNLKNMNSIQEIQGIEREVRVHSLLKHANIIEYHDSFQENELVFIVLDYAVNGNLYSHLYKKRNFTEKEGYKYFSQTCEAIKYLHSINIVHRDLKPENILLDEDYNIKLCDFGWCTEDIENPRSTFCGTYEYMAPEIVFRQPYDYRIDIWALGVLLYELLHGSAPFKGKTFKEIQRKIEKGDVQFSDSISDISKQLICKVLQANPTRRISIEDIMTHPWMYKMKQIEKDEKKHIDNIGKQQSSSSTTNLIKQTNENDAPKTKEITQAQKKPDNRSQSPIIGGNLKNNQMIEIKNENTNNSNNNNNNNKMNEKENIQNAYSSICNNELSERKKNNTPNKTTESISKNMNDPLLLNFKKQQSNNKNLTTENDLSSQNILSGSKIPLSSQLLQNQQQLINLQQQNNNGMKDRINERNINQQQQQQNILDSNTKMQNNISKTNNTIMTNVSHDENPFKNLDSKDIASITNIAKKQQEMMMKLGQNSSSQNISSHNQFNSQSHSSNNNFQTNQNNINNNNNNQNQIQQGLYNSNNQSQIPQIQIQNWNKQQNNQENQKSHNNLPVATESAYSKDIDENSVKNSQKPINTSRFMNKHSNSTYGNPNQNNNNSVSNSISCSSSVSSNNFIQQKQQQPNQFNSFHHNHFMNQTDEIKLLNDNFNNSYIKTEANNHISHSYLPHQNNNKLMNTNTSIGQEESCFSLFGCLGPSHISTTQRNREGNSQNQRMQAKSPLNNSSNNIINHNNPSFSQQNFSSAAFQAGQGLQSHQSSYSIQYGQQQDNRPRVNSTNLSNSNSFLNKQVNTGLNLNNNHNNQYSTVAQNNKEQQSQIDTFSTQRSSNSLAMQKTPSISNHSFLGQHQSNSRGNPHHSSIISNNKIPFSDKTNLPVSAIPTKQINLQDERRNLQKLSTSTNCSKDFSSHNNNTMINNNNNNNMNGNNSNYTTNQFLTKERSLTQDYNCVQNQNGSLNQSSSQFFPSSKLQQQSQANNTNNYNNTSLNNYKLENSKNSGQSFHDSRSNRTGQRSRTLIFEELNTEKTKSVIESMEQMISFVKNALPFSSSQTTSSKLPTQQNNNNSSSSQLNNMFQLGNHEQTNYNDISQQINISVLQNTSLQKAASLDTSYTPTSLNLNQKNNSKSIININHLKAQRMDSNQNNDTQKQLSPSSLQLILKTNSNNNNITPSSNNSIIDFSKNKQKIFGGDKNGSNTQSFHSSQGGMPMQSIGNMNNMSVNNNNNNSNNYFTQKTSSTIQSYSHIPQQVKNQFHQNDYSMMKQQQYQNEHSSVDQQHISVSQRR